MSYMTLQGGHDFDYGYCGSGSAPPSAVEVSINWLYQSGGMDVQTYTGIDSDCEPYNSGFDANDPIGKTGFYPSYEDADATGSFNLPAETDHFANTNLWPVSNLNHSLNGANQWFQLNDKNAWEDKAAASCGRPWTNGGGGHLAHPSRVAGGEHQQSRNQLHKRLESEFFN